ncbi:hypothetical protein BGX23_011034 [Mortierella sp. AD031]|nr:hypothetical protein BGX23_011034 [Mortierella sp. AD031]
MEAETECDQINKALTVTHLVLEDNRLQLPIQRHILKRCPDLIQLEICYSQRSDGEQLGALVRDYCPMIRRLTLRSSRQPWSLAMIERMPESVEELILHTGQLDLDMAGAINDRKDTLTRLDLDFGNGARGKRRLESVMTILRKCSNLREFTYHNHADDTLFKEVMLSKSWDLPKLIKLGIHGVGPRTKRDGLPQTPVPIEWWQQCGGKRKTCCSARSMEDVQTSGPEMSPLFDIALLNHVQGLPKLSEVVVTESTYHKRIRLA